MTLGIIVPAYNEQDHIESTIDELIKIQKYFNNSLDINITIINDCSTDNTQKIINEKQKQYKNFKLISNEINLGLGGSYKKGLEQITEDFVTWIPADNSHDLASLIPSFELIGQADIILPVPMNKKVRNIKRRIISNLFTFLINILTKNNIKYYNGLAIYKTKLIKDIEIASNGFGFQAEILVKLLKNNAQYIYANTVIKERANGRSKAFNIKNIKDTIKTILNLRKI